MADRATHIDPDQIKDDSLTPEELYKANSPAIGTNWVTIDETDLTRFKFVSPPLSGGDYKGYYNVSNGLSSTTSRTWQEKLKLTFTAEAAGYFEIHWSANTSHYDGGVFRETRIQIDDTTTYNQTAEELYNFKYADGAWGMRSGMIVISLSQGQHTIDLDFRTGTSGKAMYIKEAYITARKIT